MRARFFRQYFRCYSPVAFPKKWDKNGDYVRHWLPQLAKLPAKYIYEPWLAPIAVQKAAGCVVGKDYPKPIVDHKVVSKQHMESMKQAYDRHKASSGASGAAAAAAAEVTLPGGAGGALRRARSVFGALPPDPADLAASGGAGGDPMPAARAAGGGGGGGAQASIATFFTAGPKKKKQRT